MESLSQMLERNARLVGDQVFVYFEDQKITYAELKQRADKAAAVLAMRGVKKGDPVGLFLPNGMDLVLIFWACQNIGAVAVPMTSMLKAPEVSNIICQTKVKIIFCDKETRTVISDLENDITAGLGMVVFGEHTGSEFYATADKSHVSAHEVTFSREDLATVFFTSGTTGTPKGAMQSQFSQYSAVRDMMGFNHWQYGNEVLYCALPITNNMACTCMMNLCMFAGGTLVLDARWDTRRALDAIKHYRVTFMAGPPTIYVYMMNEFDPARDEISSLKLCIAGGAPVPTEIIKRFETLGGCRLSQAYGATEVLAYVTADPFVGERKLGSAGLPIGSTRIKILDDEGREVPPGETGEVCISGDTVGSGYWGDPDLTAKSFTQLGWLSGDIGRLDDDGYLYIVDRKKDLIISGGFNIYPIEVENVLYQLSGVKLCAVVGIPDEKKGEVAVAAVIADPSANLSLEVVIEFCRQHLAAYKVPRKVAFMDELPTNPIGKVLKRVLRDSMHDNLKEENRL